MSEIQVGPQDRCVQCSLSLEEVRYSQRTQEPLYCATEDPWGEIDREYERHKFIWTAKDQQREERMKALWAAETWFTTPEIPTTEASASTPTEGNTA